MRTTGKLAAVVGTAAIALTMSTTSASADSSSCTTDSGCAGKVDFNSESEIFTVSDQVGDGHSALAAYWLPDGSGPHLIWNAEGSGTSVEKQVEFAEGAWVTIRACLGEHGTLEVLWETCGEPVTDFA